MKKLIEKDMPLPPHTKLDYYECYAKIVLEEMFPKQFSDLIISDKPDLQNAKLSIGIEVTSSENSSQKEVEGLYTKWSYQNNDKKERIREQIEKRGAKLMNGVLSGIPEHDSFDRIYDTLNRKLEKLKDYELFEKQYLFTFSSIYTTPTMREEALFEMRRICEPASSKFYGIYVLVPGSIYVFDLANNTTCEKKITFDIQHFQAQRAREMVEQEEKSIG